MIWLEAEFRLLGDVEVLVAGRPIPIGHARQRAVLVTLLIEANRSVSADLLVDRVWAGHRLPADPRNAIRTYISLLRRALRESNAIAVVRQSAGYRLAVDPSSVDLHRFHGLVRQGRDATSDIAAASHLEDALRLWRGEPFAGLDTIWVNTVRAGLVEARRAAQLDLADIKLRLGQHAALVAELSDRGAEDPLDERAAGQLMTALYRCGRQADALTQYEQIRRRLADELGAVPGEPLQDLHRAILVADPALRAFEPNLQPAPAGDEGADGGPAKQPPHQAVVPAQLPADVSAFTGRTAELATLDSLTASPASNGATAVVISAIAGTAGVGKTALAVHWAHRVAGRFPDGQLYVNLRGYDPDRPMTAADALARFLDALGVAGLDIPLELDERSARYRTELAGRRMLIVLDNAATAEQVRPLLPGAATCAVVVTSRDSLAGLVALHGARRVDLDVLPPADAHALLRRLIGVRVDTAPEAAKDLADQCARLPLALRIAAELALSRPATPLAGLTRELADQQQRLNLLGAGAGGDPRAAVAGVFSWSLRQLTPGAARAFRLLGLHPGTSTDAHGLAALAGTGLAHAQRILDTLARAHLLHPVGADRYGMHDLLRAYAVARGDEDDTAAERRAALGRMFDHYLATAAAAMDILHPAEAHRRPRVPLPGTARPELADANGARRWLDMERSTLVAVAVDAAARGWPAHTIRLSAVLFRYLDGGYHPDAIAIHTYAYKAAQRSGDLAAQASALRGLGTAHQGMDQHTHAAGHLRQALALFRDTGDHLGEAGVHNSLGNVERRRGRYEAAAGHYEQALALFRRCGDLVGQSQSLDNLGVILRRLGQFEPAASCHEQALAISLQTGNPAGTAHAQNHLGLAEQELGRFEAAATHHEQALAGFRQLGHRSGEAAALDNLGIIHTRLGRPQQATAHFDQALALFRAIGERDGEAWALNGLGEAARLADRPADAIAHHAAALHIATDMGALDQQVRARAGLDHAQHALGVG